MARAAGARVVDPARRQSVDEAIVAHVQAVLPPARAALAEMLARVAVIRAEVQPWLAEQAKKPWAERARTCWVLDLTPAVAAVVERLAGVEGKVADWEAQVRALTPRAAHRHGPYHRRFARALLHEPTQLLVALENLRKQVDAVEAQVARVGPLAPSPRTVWTPVDPRELRGPEIKRAKTQFSPFEVGH